MRHATLALVVVFGLSALVAAQGVKINEVNTLLDYIEIMNVDDSSTVDISGYHLLYFEDTQLPGGASYTFPGVAGSGTTVLGPNECLIVTDSAAFAHPIVPVGTQIFYYGANILWNAGEAGSALLADDLGNGVDYYAHGNPNQLLCPLEAATFMILPGAPATPTVWTGTASPGFASTPPNSLDVHRRHTRVDADSAADRTMLADGNDTPGVPNPFQLTNASPQYTGLVPLVAAFTPNVTAGGTPLTVDFTNESTGEEDLTLVVWSFGDAAATQSFDHNTSFTYTAGGTFNVTLDITDTLGTSTTLPTVITAIISIAPVPLAVSPFKENFEGPISANGTTADAANGWELNLPNATSQIRTVDPATIGAIGAYTNATGSSGPTAAVLDSSVSGNLATNELVLHIDLAILMASDPAGEFNISYWMYENLDEINPEDAVVFTDGVTVGNGVNNLGASTGLPGSDTFQEVLLNPWNNNMVDRTWTKFNHTIDAAFLAANGLAASSDARIVFRQADNFLFNGGDGLVIDEVVVGTVGLQILKTPLVPGPGISIDINNLGMTPNSGFVTVITPFQGNFPNGWFFGLDPSLQDVGDALLVPQPAVFSFRNGTLDASGNSFYSLPLPGVPGLGVTIYGVTVEHTGWIPTGSSEPISANL